MKSCVVVFSGGQDSTTCLYWALRHFSSVQALGFSYGQRHSVELEQAAKIAEIAGVPFTVQSLPGLFSKGALVDNTVIPASVEPGIAPTFVPGRNLVFLSLATAFAACRGIHDIVTGVNQQDYSGYPDCRGEFIDSLECTARFALEDASFNVHTPLLHLTKADIWKYADMLGCFEVVRDFSHTCYRGEREHVAPWGKGCGCCAACMLREKGWNEYAGYKASH